MELLSAQSGTVLKLGLRRADWRFALVSIWSYVGHSPVPKKYISSSLTFPLKLDSTFIRRELSSDVAFIGKVSSELRSLICISSPFTLAPISNQRPVYIYIYYFHLSVYIFFVVCFIFWWFEWGREANH